MHVNEAGGSHDSDAPRDFRRHELTTAMFNTKTVKLNHLTATEYDYETFHILPLMSERTICIQDEGGWSGVGGSAVEH